MEAKQLDIDSSIKLQAARDKTITHFGTLSGFGPLFPYTFENQPRVKAEWIRSTIISALRKENVESIGALRKKRNDEQFNYERLIGAQKVPLFSIGSDIPAAFLGWLLPAISIALLVVAAGHRRQLVRVCERLHLADQDRLTLAETWSHNPFRQSGWSRIWRALLDGVGLFSLAIVGITVHLAIMQGVRSTAAAIVAVVLLGAASVVRPK